MSEFNHRPAPTPVRWEWTAFDDVTPRALYAALALRQQVFGIEQQCIYLDTDGRDVSAYHLFGWIAESTPAVGEASTARCGSPLATGPTVCGEERLVAYLRVLPIGVAAPEETSLGRVVVDPVHRGRGLGCALMEEALKRAPGAVGTGPMIIHAQAYLEPMYARFGFVTCGAAFDEDGILHVPMRRG